ncbi:MAG: hypothetical protein M0Z92_07995 [Actinomycetota bacterium]|nr:hypothetical protein [Actinomycetota bacterium]
MTAARAQGGRVITWRWTPAKVTWVAVLLALALRLYMLATPTHLGGIIEYDDAVYFGTSLLMTHGLLPYRDFVMVQPPGVPTLMLPLAFLAHFFGTRSMLEATRVVTCMVGAANVGLVGYLLRRRSIGAVVVGTGFMTVYASSVLTSQTLLLEPYLNLLVLGALAVLLAGEHLAPSWWRILLAGGLLGMAGAVKSWAIMPAVIVAVVVALRSRRDLLVLGAGIAAGFALLAGPFFMADPGAFVRQVVLDQFGRAGHRTAFALRVGYLTGFPISPISETAWVAAPWLVAAVTGLAYPFFRVRARLSDSERIVLACLAVVLVAMLVPPDFFYHYAAFLAPFAAMAWAYAWERLRPLRAARRRLPPWALVPVALGAMAVASAVHLSGYQTGVVDPSAVVKAVVPAGACVVTDTEEISILSDRFFASAPGCPVIIDAFGTDLAYNHAVPPADVTAVDARLEDFWLSAFARADYVVLSANNAARIPWTPRVLAYLRANFHPVGEMGVEILARNGA